MQVITVYRYERAPGKVTISPVKPQDKDSTELKRIIADDGKLLTKDGVTFYESIHSESAEGFYEVEDPDYQEVSENEEN